MIKHSIFKEYEFDNEYYHEDYKLWLELLRNGMQIEGLNEVLAFYRSGGRSSKRLNSAKNRWLIYRNAENLCLFKSIRCFLSYSYFSVKKYYFPLTKRKQDETI
jgi:hypothetical protein